MATYPPETNDGVVTSWVPLTSIFTPSVGCESKFRLDGPSLMAYDPGYGLDIDKKVKCGPPAVTTWWEQGRLGGGNDAGHTAVSLGPVTCPNAWTTVASSSTGSSTQIMCCPPDYYLANGISGSVAGDCLSDVTSGAVLTFAFTTPGSSNAWKIATTTLAGKSTVGAIAVVGWNIALQTTSRTSSSTATSSLTSTSPPASTATTTSSSTPTTSTSSTTSTTPTAAQTSGGSSSPDQASSSPGLSTGATVGIGVGVALGVIGLVALLVIVYLMRSRKHKAATAAAAAAGVGPADGFPPQPKPGEAYAPHEIGTMYVGELPAAQREYRPPPQELA